MGNVLFVIARVCGKNWWMVITVSNYYQRNSTQEHTWPFALPYLCNDLSDGCRVHAVCLRTALRSVANLKALLKDLIYLERWPRTWQLRISEERVVSLI